MSAIAAIYRLNGRPLVKSELAVALDSLEHRGGEDRGLWTDKSVGLGHLMRWTTPESLGEKLPFQGRESRNVITCDARIDNREELIESLSLSNRPKKKITDSEIVLAAYERWGIDCLPKLIGDFVFAIWNEREQTLFASRDPLGVKHFYYFYKPGTIFALASEVKALLKIEGIACELDEQQLGDYLVANFEDKQSTFYKGIKRLPATHALSVGRKELKIWKYWKPDTTELRLRSDDEYREAFKERFTAAVKARTRSAFPVGSMLSGGLDSSSISGVASRILSQEDRGPLETFSAVFPTIAKTDPRIDERRHIDSVISHIDCHPNFVEADAVSPFVDIERLHWHTDHPVGLPIYMDWEIFKAAERRGVRTILSGFDGDSTVSYGYEDLANFALRGQFVRLTTESLRLRKNMPRRSHTLKRLMWHRGISKAIPPSVYSLWRTLRRRRPEDFEKSSIAFPLHYNAVRKAFRDEFDLEGRISRLQTAGETEEMSPIEHHWNALTSGHFASVLENVEKAAAAFGVEARFPFFDRQLIEFCIALPPGQRLSRGWTRGIFRHSMAGLIPEDVRWRTDKSNIGASVKINMQKLASRLLDRSIEESSGMLEEYVDLDVLKEAYRDYIADPLERESEALLMLMSVYLLNWLEQSGLEPGYSGDPKTAQTTIAA